MFRLNSLEVAMKNNFNIFNFNRYVRLVSNVMPARHLYSNEQLNITNYIRQRESIKKNLDAFSSKQSKIRLQSVCASNMYYQHLKNFIHFTSGEKDDFDLLKVSLYKLVNMYKTYDGPKRNFGVAIMHMFHYLKRPNEAIAFYNDEFIGHLFEQWGCYKVLLDLLYEHQKYEDVIRVYNRITSLRTFLFRFELDLIVLASLYRLNTPVSYSNALNILNSINDFHIRALRTFVAGLAVNQKDPEMALKVMENDKIFDSAHTNIKLLAWSQLRKFSEVFDMMKSIIENSNQICVPKQVCFLIEKDVLHHGVSDDVRELSKILQKMKTLELITDNSFDDIICNLSAESTQNKLDKYQTKNKENSVI